MTGTKREKTEWSVEDMKRLARSGVAKVDLLGTRGTTLLTMDECEAVVCALVASGYLNDPTDSIPDAEIITPKGDTQ